MKTVRKIVVLWLLCFTIQIQLIQGCRSGWIQHGDSCYLLSKDAESWGDASIICITLLSRLAAVESADENNFLKAEAQRLHAQGYWIDGTDVEVENVWRWTASGDKISYLNWGGQEPNAGESGNCLALWRDFGYQWADESCHAARNFICEMRADVDANYQVVG
ncbi:perlucin-like [Argopecten irradians]|uniref:perlucin-like n=1 Tax=Argopecten irradians TaxID=31199 RepID=UPI003715548F